MPKFYVVPSSELKTDEINAMRTNVARALVNLALDKKIAASEDQLIVRDIQPNTDLAFATNNWVNQALLAPNAWTQDFLTALAGAQQKRCIAFYKVVNLTAIPQINLSRFSLGTTSVLGTIDLEALYAEQQTTGFFGPVFWADGENVRVEHYPLAGIAAGAERIAFPGLVVEALGQNISVDAKSRLAEAKYLTP